VRESPLYQGLSHPGDLAGARRHRGDRLRLVHRVPLLHGRLSLRGAALQLVRARPRERRGQPRDPHSGQPPPGARRGGEVHLLHPADPWWTLPGLRRNLPGGSPQVRKPARSGERDPVRDEAQANLRLEGRSRHSAQVLLLSMAERESYTTAGTARARGGKVP
jgi:hypothetical protein